MPYIYIGGNLLNKQIASSPSASVHSDAVHCELLRIPRNDIGNINSPQTSRQDNKVFINMENKFQELTNEDGRRLYWPLPFCGFDRVF